MFRKCAPHSFKVSVLGAAGGIGQPLSLLMKASPLVTELAVYDRVAAPGVGADLSYINTHSKVTSHLEEDIESALTGSNVVLIPAGVPRKPGMTRDDLFNTNASIIKALAHECAKFCPKACILIIANPVNSTVPIATEAFKEAGVYDRRKMFGVTTLDVVRARSFVAEKTGANPSEIDITVVGGHSGSTIVPLLSQNKEQYAKLSEEDIKALTHRIQFGGDEVVKAKDGAGSATLSMAYAGAEFAFQVLRGLKGETGVEACSFVESSEMPGCQWFSTRVTLGKEGIEKIAPIGDVSPFEKELLEKCATELKGNITKGVSFAKK